MPRPLTATIHLDALTHNLGVARAKSQGAKVWAVVKAHAYGHGLERALRAFAGADGLALIEPERAILLRELGWSGPLLLLEGVFAPEDVALLAQYGLESTVHTMEQIEWLAAARLAEPVDVHLKVNTGMNRLGFPPAQVAQAYAALRAIPAVRSIRFMTHFANSDVVSHPLLSMREQIARFEQAVGGLPGERSLSNSGAVLHQAELAGVLKNDWVRPGIMLYGGTPGAGSAAEYGLLPGMTLASEVIGVQMLEPGAVVGYGSRFQAPGPMRVGVVACGYADGYPRHAPHGTPILVHPGRSSRHGHPSAPAQASTLVGRVSMDMLMVDLTHLPDAGVGTAVTLWGAGLPIDTVAGAAGTIGYELMCALAPRVRVLEGNLNAHG